MPCYNSIDGEPASVSHRLLTELLRERMGFDGLCISDYGGISNAHEVQRIGETIGETGFLAMEAGMDMEMPKAIGYGEKTQRNVPKRTGGYRIAGPDSSEGVGSEIPHGPV